MHGRRNNLIIITWSMASTIINEPFPITLRRASGIRRSLGSHIL